MTHTFITVIAAVPVEQMAEVRAMVHALGNPAEARMAEALDAMGALHFASLNLFAASAGDRGHLILELSGDGPAGELLSSLADKTATRLEPIFAHARDRGSASLPQFWHEHAVEVGQGLWSNPGVNFTGTPAMSVERIRREAGLARRVALLLEAGSRTGGTALERLGSVRAALAIDPDWHWSLEPEALPEGGTGGDLPDTIRASLPVVLPLALPFARTFFWPLAALTVAVAAIAWGMRGFEAHEIFRALVLAVVVAVLAGLVTVWSLYRLLRRREMAEVPVDRPPDLHRVNSILARENFASQNHLAALSVMKPGRHRRLTLLLAFWFMAQLSARYFRPGFLGTLGTIHFLIAHDTHPRWS